jgi:type 1 glutamine amidotransferase
VESAKVKTGAVAAVLLFSMASAAGPRAAAPRKQLLAIGEEKGYRHESVTHALATIERLGRESGLWDTFIRTDTEPLTKKKLEYNAKNLNDFDAVVFYTGGDLEMDEPQKKDFLSFIHDDGKGFVGIHSATITFTHWQEYGEMIGGYFDEHPWGTFNAPIVVEDPSFPGMGQFPRAFSLLDEIYQVKNFSREKCRVLMRLDANKLDLKNPRVHRTDRDFAVAWAKTYGKGRVYYSTLGHRVEDWDLPGIQKMYAGAIQWALRLEDADVTPRPAAGE